MNQKYVTISKNYNLISFSLVCLTVLSVIILSSCFVSADDVIDDVLINISVSCTMTGTGQNSHNAEVPNGTYRDEIGITTLKVACNDTEGFAIYAIGFTGEQYTGEDHTKLIGTSSNQKISTGTATSGSTSNWAMKLATDNTQTYPITLDNSFNNYHIVPDTYTKVAHRDSGTDVGTTATGATLTTTYASFISAGQVADTYSGKVKYTLVHPANETPLQPQTTASGKICYYPNGSNIEGTMGCQTISDVDRKDWGRCFYTDLSTYCKDTQYNDIDLSELSLLDNATKILLASNYSRTGYGFAGWSDTFDYESNPNAKFYGPHESITFAPADFQSPNNGLSLYAVWVKSEGLFQDVTKATMICGGLTAGATNLSSVSALTDVRDNQTYAIAKLEDGQCWMIENLRLDNTAEHNADGSFAQGYDDRFAGLANPELPWEPYATTANSLYSADGANNTIRVGVNTSYLRFPRYNNYNTSARASNPTTNDTEIFSYGNYYTWPATIADVNSYSSFETNVVGKSICPSGWRLPKGSGKTNIANNDFWTLIVEGLNDGTFPENHNSTMFGGSYSGVPEGETVSKKIRAYPNNFVYSGEIRGDPIHYRGNGGRLWTSTIFSSETTFHFSIDNRLVYPGDSQSIKSYAFPIRCINNL